MRKGAQVMAVLAVVLCVGGWESRDDLRASCANHVRKTEAEGVDEKCRCLSADLRGKLSGAEVKRVADIWLKRVFVTEDDRISYIGGMDNAMLVVEAARSCGLIPPRPERRRLPSAP